MSPLPQTRRSLLLELGKKSDGAWAEFLEVYEHALRAYCRKLGLDAADAEDATQEVLAAVHQRIPTWDHDASGSFRAWLFRVARNITIDLIAARARRAGNAAHLDDVDVLGLRATHEATLEREYARATLDWAADRVQQEVSEGAWQAFTLTAVRGRSPESAAEALGMTVGAVYTAKSRVIARLRTRVASLEEGNETNQPKDDAR
ncbi:MAG: sigma-70 family RNA polymerase sigma factor [Planctomycetota bacterium]